MRGSLGWRAWNARQGRAAGMARSRQGARQVGRVAGARQQRTGCAGRAGVRAGTAWEHRGAQLGAQGRAVGRTERAGHGRPGRGLGAGWVRRLGQLGQFWCTVHLAQFWLGF